MAASKATIVILPEGSSIPDKGTFTPGTVTIKKEERVTWKNEDTAAHTITSGKPGYPDGNFDSGLFTSKGEFTHTLMKKGEYPYYCLVHPWKKGKIIVK